MTVIAPGIRFLDLRFQGSPQVVATGVLESGSRVALIDPEGPAEPKNAILLRADLRTLFDLNLLRVKSCHEPPEFAAQFLRDALNVEPLK